ncbi:MAG: hypothetical protein Q8O26_14975 [Phreatobacter sp.]|uniref:hypothetical protein n=1 Tax=Phreatobacter sp. TaxID=1966341 RepID=UPI0027322FC6|nr:hypothetical protein [Phreatobacter sp.]MDP2803174.1 hypothetical protein [Phreatobacter sp.]
MLTVRTRHAATGLAIAALAVALGACASNYATQGPLTVSSSLPPAYIASCIEGLFNTRHPPVRRSPLIGGTLIKAMDDNDRTIAAVSVLSEAGETSVAFVSDHADRSWYEHLFRQCVALPGDR